MFSSNQEHAEGSLADVSLDNKVYEWGFLAFFCLIGTVYFKEHATGFDTPSPATHFSKFINSTSTAIQGHITWLDDIWQNIWDRLSWLWEWHDPICGCSLAALEESMLGYGHVAPSTTKCPGSQTSNWLWLDDLRRQPHHWMGRHWQHSSNSATNTANVPLDEKRRGNNVQ